MQSYLCSKKNGGPQLKHFHRKDCLKFSTILLVNSLLYLPALKQLHIHLTPAGLFLIFSSKNAHDHLLIGFRKKVYPRVPQGKQLHK